MKSLLGPFSIQATGIQDYSGAVSLTLPLSAQKALSYSRRNVANV